MTSNHQNKLLIGLSLGNAILISALLFLFYQYSLHTPEAKILSSQRETQLTGGIVKDAVYQEASPDGENIIILYEVPDNIENQYFIAIKNKTSKRENYIFVSEFGNGLPEWLGNESIYFTTYCGTPCQGLDLVDTGSKEKRSGVLSYMVLDQTRGPYTVFRDWFGKEFEFNGLVDNITSETVKDKVYLIFQMKNDEGKPAGQKRFLFTGKALEE